MLPVVWWSSNIRTETIGIIDSVTLMYLMFYVISPVFSSCPVFPTALSILPPYPTPHPLPPPPSPLHPRVQYPPAPTISKQPRALASAPSSLRDSKSLSLQYIARPCSASLICKNRSPQIPPPPLLSSVVVIPITPTPVSLAVSPLSALQPRVEIFPGTFPCRCQHPHL